MVRRVVSRNSLKQRELSEPVECVGGQETLEPCQTPVAPRWRPSENKCTRTGTQDNLLHRGGEPQLEGTTHVKELGKTEGAATTAPVVRADGAQISQARNQP
jgi:hypothetical protein